MSEQVVSIPLEGGMAPDEPTELVLERARVHLEYTELQAELQEEREPNRVVGLLRELATLRAELARLDAAVLALAPPVPADPWHVGDPIGGPDSSWTAPDLAEAADLGGVAPDRPIEAADEANGEGQTTVGADLSSTVHIRPDGVRHSDGTTSPMTDGPAEEPAGDVGRQTGAVDGDTRGVAPLTLRLVIEGPTGAGVTTVLGQLRDHFDARHHRAAAKRGSLVVDLYEFEAGSFGEQRIAFELIRLSGGVDRSVRRYVRSMADAIIVVVDARPTWVTRSLGHVGELLDEQRETPGEHRPAVTIFANKSDLEDAVDAEWITAALPAGGVAGVVSTSRDQGYLFGFVRATNAGMRRVQSRVADGLVRTQPLGFDGLLRLLASEMEPRNGATTSIGGERVVDRPPQTSVDGHRPEAGSNGSPARGRTRALRRLIDALRTPGSDQPAQV